MAALPQKEAVLALVVAAMASKAADWASHGLEIIKESAVGCLRFATCVEHRYVLNKMQLVGVASRIALENNDAEHFAWPSSCGSEEVGPPRSMLQKVEEEIHSHAQRKEKYVSMALQELDDEVFEADPSISALRDEARIAFKDLLVFLRGTLLMAFYNKGPLTFSTANRKRKQLIKISGIV